MRWMWLAKLAMMTRPLAWEMICSRVLPTSASLGVKLGFMAPVESLIIRSTPCSEKRVMAAKSVVTPSMGV